MGAYDKSCFKEDVARFSSDAASLSVSPAALSTQHGNAYVFNLTASSKAGNGSANQVVDIVESSHEDLR